jgi:hypothetical protein
MIKTTFDDPLAWAERNGLDYEGLRQLDFRVSHVDPILDGDQRVYCDAIMGEPGMERLCRNLAKDQTRYCGTHQRHRRPVQLFGPEMR